MKIPRCMSTQHPDNVSFPFFSDSAVMDGESEVKEAFYAFSHLNCDEQMWDAEGKEVDNFVVKKLLANYEPFFKRKKLGEDVFLTFRIPNPSIEKDEAKILLETLESIPRSSDIARSFYGEDISPIFEVILPMAKNSDELNRIYHYYKKFVVGKSSANLFGLSVSEWTGNFKPDSINVIPLFETKDDMLNSAIEVGKYFKDKNLEHQRVFLARSDPAINYGSTTAVLINLVALQRLNNLSEISSVDIFPMIGVGSAPFRGNLSPRTVKRSLATYPSVQTYTLQSAFKYDYDESLVRSAIQELHDSKRKKPRIVEEDKVVKIIHKLSEEYRSQIRMVLQNIQELSIYIPQRRRRKMHIGLYRYSRQVEGLSLPRAIPFCAVMYSMGLPPDILGLNALSESELDYVKDIYPSFEFDLKDALQFYNPVNLKKFPQLEAKILPVIERFNVEPSPTYSEISSNLLDNVSKRNFRKVEENITDLAKMRGFLG